MRHKLNSYKAQVEGLEDIVLALDQVCDSRSIPKIINDEVIEIYEIMMQLDSKASYLKAGHSNAKVRSSELSNETEERSLSRLCPSDAKIAQLRVCLNEAGNILKKRHRGGYISTTELQNFTLELEWLHLQVYVVSNIAQGHKAYTKHDILTANAFYKNAQTELMRSSHPDERRHKMIKQLADILFGRRKFIDKELMPEDEFNPESTIPPDKNEGEMSASEIAAIQLLNKSNSGASITQH